MLNWIKAFDGQRSHRVRYGNALAKSNLLQTAPLQGAVTSCTLYNVFINDIAELEQTVTGVKCLLYADDPVLWYSAPMKNALDRTESALNCALKLLAYWYKDTTIYKINVFTYLGMTFDTKLAWKSHIAKMADRVSNRLNVLKRLAGSVWGCACSNLNTTYKMFIQPIVLYRCEPLITATEVTLKPLEKAHNQTLRLITGVIKSTPIDVMLLVTIKSTLIDAMLQVAGNTTIKQMRSLAIETINVNYPADQWLQVFTDGSNIVNQANVSAGVYSELFSFYVASGQNRSAFEEGVEAISGKRYELLGEKNKTVVLQWIPGHCGIKGNEVADTRAKNWTTILQCMDQPTSFHIMMTLIRREFQTSRYNELKARTKEKQWTVALSDIPDWPRIEAVAEFRLRTGHDSLAKHLHRLGVYAQPTCS
ncbi:unnamed protein product [Rodentolepis nana]|uniref:RNase H domain-containing protein n=1 Tax=Rodentolepis nana TaxID=102285 RepID=A0A0R3TXG8_RODNA|nr:unnamed protein product [Rodentolepis nana]